MKKKTILCLLLCAAMTVACACGNSNDKDTSSDNKKATTDTKESIKSKEEKNVTTDFEESTVEENTSNEETNNFIENGNNIGESEKVPEVSTEPVELPEVDEPVSEPEENTEQSLDVDMSQKVKDYILNGQSGAEATEIKWSPTFLNSVDIDSLYGEFVANGGRTDDVSGVAAYITINAPIASNWQEMFQSDLYNAYGVTPTKIEYIEGDLYQAYIMNEGKEVPYVAVNARTGYFHG